MIKLKNLLKESYVWERKFGEKLPTLADVQKKYQKKLNEGVIKVTKQPFPDVKNGLKQLKGEDKIKWLVWQGSYSKGKAGYEIKGKKLNVIGLNPRDRGFYVNHFGNRTGIRRANLYYDGKNWKTGEKF